MAVLVERGGVVEVECAVVWMLVWYACECSVVACTTSVDWSASFSITTAATANNHPGSGQR